ncbi:MAG: hypothetical protein WC307_01050 [Candidatus Nanoarchaeia archaeon]|jgi:predicted DNA-binding helix-hairpin-helix protein
MKVFDYISGLTTYVRDDSLLVKVNNKFAAWSIKNKVELEGYPVEVERNNNHFIVRIWGAGLMDAYLLRNIDGIAA